MAPRIESPAGNPKEDLKKIFLEAITAASGEAAVKKNLSLNKKRTLLKAGGASFKLSGFKNILVIGAGKAVCRMAKAVEDILGNRIASGCVVTKYGHGFALKRIKTIEAGHPLPDRNGIKGVRELLRIVDRVDKDDLVICLFSGGASSLLPSPPPGISLKDKQIASRLLLRSGATIHEINTVRKHLSELKGGMLLKRLYPAKVISLVISDVVGDDLSTIASGPTCPDPTTFTEALDILKKYKVSSKTPASVLARLRKGSKGLIEETPKTSPGGCENIIIANNFIALEAAKSKAEALGYRTLMLSSSITGNSREAAKFFSAVLKEVRRTGNPLGPPACILFGGEVTIEIKGKGIGGRMQEFALSSALDLAGTEGITLLAAGTDGTDGSTDAAGAFADSKTIERAAKAGLDAAGYLGDNDSYSFFKKLKSLFITGPTGTNVMDIVAGVVE